jgi:hypothetical protein
MLMPLTRRRFPVAGTPSSLPWCVPSAVKRTTTLLRWDEAAAQFERALEKNQQVGARLWTAHTESEFARMLLQRSAPGDGRRAILLLRSALTASRELGMRALQVRVAAQLQALGVN